jgi:hypothetical protein
VWSCHDNQAKRERQTAEERPAKGSVLVMFLLEAIDRNKRLRPSECERPELCIESSPLNCKSSIFSVGSLCHRDAQARRPSQRLGRGLAPLVLMPRAKAGAPNRKQFALVQYPHNAQKPGNSGDRNQKGEYRYLSPVKAIVF